MARTLLYLHRHDLRLHDNPILEQIRKGQYDSFLPVYIFPAHQIEVNPLLRAEHQGKAHKELRASFGTRRTGNVRVSYLCESLWDLKRSYAKLDVNMLITAGKTDDVLKSILDKLQAHSAGQIEVWLQKEYTTEEREEEAAIMAVCKSNKTVAYKTVEESTLVDISDLGYPIDKLPNYYTEFRKGVEPLDSVRLPFEAPKHLPPSPKITFENEYEISDDMDKVIEQLCAPLGGRCDIPQNTAHPMKGGETAAIKRLEYYVTGGKSAPAASYKTTRNGLLGSDYSTKFSSFLSVGSLSPKLIHHRLLQFEKEHNLEGDVNTYWIRFELLWRDYFKFVALKFGKRMFLKYGLKQAKLNDQWLGADSREAMRWKEGTTGVGIVDAAMRELKATGYLSNRARQIVASFLTKDLNVDWRIGAEYFEEKLIDHDPSANYGNWQYQAGVGNDPRTSRRFNPAKQAHDYDPDGAYIKTWCPEVAKATVSMNWVYFWTTPPKLQQTLGIAGLEGVRDPVKGLCGDERERNSGRGVPGYRKKARRHEGRPRRGERTASYDS
ncbi:DNA photolyase, FAD-binding/Cryptochrome [Protomyces lactucae-debilis]|uniref:Cryptochrome DASH n=1 Tax=Protomyces lactucae-debilis TaxID=2754530 RepID=A0A1Y2FHA1_PROLT|nr:DNA photolyase, FAD-binding/Cryptochrome [Protomyces lactucae-debilis]ORY83309.1 DNA photolyase, FAD-binding/Cryptochrome [Protomyces lactucae-debilis]